MQTGERKCAGCGADISHKRSDAVYCSDLCQKKGWNRAHPDSVKRSARKKYDKTKVVHLARCRQWVAANPEASRDIKRAHKAKKREENRKMRWPEGHLCAQCKVNISHLRPDALYCSERCRASADYHRNKARCHEQSNRYRAKKLAAVPADQTKTEKAKIKAIYAQAKEISRITGIVHHVDHIIPLSKGGKHIASNLRIVPWRVNLRKGAKIILAESAEQMCLFEVGANPKAYDKVA